jgi:hypothetical protein
MVDILNVRDCGALGDGTTDDTAAIQTAIEKAVESRYPVVYFPPGKYLLTSSVMIGFDNLKIIGSPGAVIVEDVASPQNAFIPLLAQKDFPQVPPAPTYNLSIEGITVEFLQAGPDNATGIQLNACVDFHVENVRISGNAAGMNDSISNGVACSYPESTGVFRNVTVVGMSKPGLYAADGHDIRFEGCIAKNCFATRILSEGIPLKVPGFAVGNAKNVVLIGCYAYENSGAGAQISNLATKPPNPYSNVQVIGGHFHHNGTHGILSGTNVVGTRGDSLQIVDADCSDNASAGIEVTSALNVSIANCITARNQTGIVVQDIAPGQGAQDQTSLVTVRGCQMYDNDNYGMILRAANDVTVENCRIYHSISDKQATGIGIWYNGTPPAQKKNMNLRIVDIDFHPMSANETPIEHLGGILSAVETGYYRLQSLTIGEPNGKVYAPAGSEYTDLQAGIRYHKVSGFDNQSWVP